MPDLTYVPLLPWTCSQCLQGGEVEISKEDVLLRLFFQQIVDQHERLSAKCHSENRLNFVKVKPSDWKARVEGEPAP